MEFDKDEVKDAVESRVKGLPTPIKIAAAVVVVMAALLIFTDLAKWVTG